jgi:hypothetical protein
VYLLPLGLLLLGESRVGKLEWCSVWNVIEVWSLLCVLWILQCCHAWVL